MYIRLLNEIVGSTPRTTGSTTLQRKGRWRGGECPKTRDNLDKVINLVTWTQAQQHRDWNRDSWPDRGNNIPFGFRFLWLSQARGTIEPDLLYVSAKWWTHRDRSTTPEQQTGRNLLQWLRVQCGLAFMFGLLGLYNCFDTLLSVSSRMEFYFSELEYTFLQATVKSARVLLYRTDPRVSGITETRSPVALVLSSLEFSLFRVTSSLWQGLISRQRNTHAKHIRAIVDRQIKGRKKERCRYLLFYGTTYHALPYC